jgi:hypothetical protein
VNASFGAPLRGKGVFRVFLLMFLLDAVAAFLFAELIGDDTPAQRRMVRDLRILAA